MSWIEEQRELLARKPSGPSPIWGILTWIFMFSCVGLAVVGAYSLVSPQLGWQYNVLSEVAEDNAKANGPRDFNDVAKKIDASFQNQMKSASAPAKLGARVGTRSRASLLGLCQLSLSRMNGAMHSLSGQRPPIIDKPEDFERIFVRLDAVVSIGSMVKLADAAHSGKENPKSKGLTEIATTAVVADFVSCALARPEKVLCHPDNRAAALSYLEAYFKNYQTAADFAKTLPPAERVEVERLFPAFKHEQIESDLDRHAKAGGIRASDVGWFADSRLKAILARHDGAPDTCAAP